MGRPPIGKVAMTSTERVHRFRAKHRADKPETKRSETPRTVIEPLRARIRELEAELAQAHAELGRRGEGRLTRSRREEFSETGKLRGEIGKLKSDIIKLKMMLQEEPDAAKLRKKVVEQQVEKASLLRELRRVAKERDQYQIRVKAYRQPKHQEARRLLTRKTYGDIIKALHPDRTKHVTASELATAGRLVTALRPLFDED